MQEIKEVIDKLSFQDRCELMVTLAPPAYGEWDEQMLKDSEAGGKLDRLMESAHQDYQDGKFDPLRWPAWHFTMPAALDYPHIVKRAGEPARLEKHPRTRVAMIVTDCLNRG